MEHEGLQIISPHVHFPQTSLFLESLADSKSIENLQCVLKKLLNEVLHITKIQKFAEIYQKWQPIQLVSAWTYLALKEVIKGVYAKNMKFAALS